jgi:hypothetical protein
LTSPNAWTARLAKRLVGLVVGAPFLAECRFVGRASLYSNAVLFGLGSGRQFGDGLGQRCHGRGGDAVLESDLGEVALNGLVGFGRLAAELELVAFDGLGNADRLVELGAVLRGCVLARHLDHGRVGFAEIQRDLHGIGRRG